MCAPVFPWTWFTLDVAYVLVLLGGTLVLRAQRKPPTAWVLFGLLSMAVGAFCFSGTYVAYADFATTTVATFGAGGLPAC